MRIVTAAFALFCCLPFLVPTWGCGGGGGAAPPPPPPGGGTVVNLMTFQSAAVVIGQPDFTSATASAGTDNGVNSPRGVGSGSVYVADSGNHRVLGFDAVPTTNHASADFVLGQPDFTFALPGLSQTGMTWPGKLCAAAGMLCVTDTVNHRVLIWNTLPTTTNAPADVVVGQPDFVTNAPTTTQTGLENPGDVCVAGGRLIVADADNHRVLVWNAVPSTNGAPADLVLGQADFVSGSLNRGGAVAADTLSLPEGVWSDGTRLAVADRFNNRVLFWSTVPTTNGQAADVVLGQADFVSNAGTAGATGMDEPVSVCSNGTQLFVGDGDNNRVLVWNAFPTANQAPADVVLGQSDFTHATPNDDDQDNVMDATPSARTLRWAFQGMPVHVEGNRLFVGDPANFRVLIFEGM